MRYEIKELNVGGVLDQAITLVKNHFKSLFLITLVLMIPFGIVAGLFASVIATNAAVKAVGVAGPEDFGRLFATFAPIYLIGLVNLIFVYPITNAATIHFIASEYLEKPADIRSAFGRAVHVFLPLIGTVILTYLAIYGVMMLTVFPVALIIGVIGALTGPIIALLVAFGLGIPAGLLVAIFVVSLQLATQVVVVDGTYGVGAIRRSRRLVKGNILSAMVLGVVVLVVQFGVLVSGRLIPQPQVQVVITTLLAAVLFIFANAAWVVFYFSCRCKLENFDLAMLADAVGRETPGTPGLNPAS